MDIDEAISILGHGTKYKTAALLAWAAALAIKHPEDIPTIKRILVILLS